MFYDSGKRFMSKVSRSINIDIFEQFIDRSQPIRCNNLKASSSMTQLPFSVKERLFEIQSTEMYHKISWLSVTSTRTVGFHEVDTACSGDSLLTTGNIYFPVSYEKICFP